MKNLLLIPLLLYASIASASAPSAGNCYLASNFGSANANGTYQDRNSDVNGIRSYVNSNNWTMYIQRPWSDANYYWVITDYTTPVTPDATSRGLGYYMNNNLSNGWEPTHDTWLFTSGYYITPVGTIATTTCPTGGSATSTASTATTTEVMLKGIAFQGAVLIVLMFLMVVGFMYNNMTDKKPWIT